MEKNPSFGAMLADIDVADLAAGVTPTINALSGEFVHAASRAWVLRRWILIGVVVAGTTALGLAALRRRKASGLAHDGEATR